MNSRVRHVYEPNIAGKKRAFQNLQFAIEDPRPWFMNAKYRPNATSLAKGKFTEWITLDNFDRACKAIQYSLEEIRFYQFDDMPEVSNEHMKFLMDWKEEENAKSLIQ